MDYGKKMQILKKPKYLRIPNVFYQGVRLKPADLRYTLNEFQKKA